MPTPYGGADTWVTTYDVPSSGDLRNAASVNVGLEALGDRTKYLYNRVHSGSNTFAKFFNNSSDTIATQFTITSTSGYERPSGNPYVDVTACAVNDWLEVWSSWQLYPSATAAGEAAVRLYFIEDQAGTPVTTPSTSAKSWFYLPDTTPLTSHIEHFSLVQRFQIQTAGTCRVGLEGKILSGTSGVLSFQGGQVLLVNRIPAT